MYQMHYHLFKKYLKFQALGSLSYIFLRFKNHYILLYRSYLNFFINEFKYRSKGQEVNKS